jgi:DNA-binding NarL/FixJ family response regulator
MTAPDSATEQGPIKVAVVDDHELVRSGICHALSTSDDTVVVGQAGDGLQALDLLERQDVDVLLLDLHMPRMDGFACLDAVRTKWPSLPVIVLTVDEDPEVAREVMRRGATAYAPKFVRPSDLVSLVRQVAGGAVIVRGDMLLGPIATVEAGPAPVGGAQGLTAREMQVLELVAQGRSNSDIARELFVTTKTVKFHLTSIFSKLGARNRTEAASLAISTGLVSVKPPQAPGRSS